MNRPAEFIENCRLVANHLGETDERSLRLECISCHYRGSDNALAYEDYLVSILVDQDSPTLTVTRKENRNPVLHIDEDGVVYRSHGEQHYLYDHVYSLTLKLK